MAGYSGTPLPKKLGIKGGTTVALIDAPDLTLWFVRDRAEHLRKLAKIVKLAEHGHVWTIWPKLTSSRASDISESYVRNAGLEAGLVDFKVCAVDDTWSGLKFAKRR